MTDLEYLKRAVERRAQESTRVADIVREVIDDIRRRGDTAVAEYSARFDDWSRPSFPVCRR